jgi:hypothetical protein
MQLAIAENSGLVIERPELPAVPTPIITSAKLIETQDDWKSLPPGVGQFPMSWVFREDSFDAVTRTRRGRLYEPVGGEQPTMRQVVPHPVEDRFGETTGSEGRHRKRVYLYTASVSLLAKPLKGWGQRWRLGRLRQPQPGELFRPKHWQADALWLLSNRYPPSVFCRK